jgi:hypothetical protein
MARETSRAVLGRAVLGRAVLGCVLIMLLAAVAGCSDFEFWGKPEKAVDPTAYPENYKKDVLTYVRTHPRELLNAREASISTPALKQFGTQSRYFACLRVNGPDWRKEKMLVFYSGEINQLIDAEGDQCSAVAYQPFPELVTEISELKGKK